MTSLTRGPLSAGVYWRRRLLVLSLAVFLVICFARVLGGGSDGSSDQGQVAQVAADPTHSAPGATGSSWGPSAPASAKTGKPGKGHSSSQAPVLAEPDGPCADGDIAVTPDVKQAVAGRDVFIVLKLRTLASEACTWRVSPQHLTLKITSGNDDIWSSRQCPRAVPTQDVVVRRDVTTSVGITWNSRRSDQQCTRLTEWALPGFYHVAAAALAGEPSDLQFKLTTPDAPVITDPAPPPGNGGKNNGKQGPKVR
ncbi:MAG: hypothetical protein JWO11_2981 [Nocardioides sp.]|nr:hypothetical protein [Nocardioides sp.]